MKSNKSNFLDYYFNLINKKPKSHILNLFLFVISKIYELIIYLRILGYKKNIFKTHKFTSTFVIGVGNLTHGGTGKTPVIIKIVDILSTKNQSIAVIARGYKRDDNKKVVIVMPNAFNFDMKMLGDEQAMIKTRYSHIVVASGSKKRNTLDRVVRHKIDFCIVDDAFQQLSISHNLNILLIDSTNPFGNEYLFPRGILRENIQNMHRSDLIILTKTNFVEKKNIDDLILNLKNIGYEKQILLSRYIPAYFYNLITNERFDLKSFSNKTVSILSGIADPSSFEKSILGLEINIKNKYIFEDHHNFIEEDLANLGDEIIIVTEKDALKLSRFSNVLQNVFVLVMDVELDTQKIEKFLV